MLNDYRASDSIRRQNRRRTLLCCSTLCLFAFLALFLLVTQVFYYRYVQIEINSNNSIPFNIMKYRSSLIQCGQSVIEKENVYPIIEQITETLRNIVMKQKNKNLININEQLDPIFKKSEIIIWLEYILAKCFQARQFSVIEQQKPTSIRQIISVLRKELLYIAGFFIKEI